MRQSIPHAPVYRKLDAQLIVPVMVAAAFLLGLRIYYALIAAPGAGPIVDTGVFFSMAKEPFFSTGLFCGLRPPLVPLIYKILDCNITAIVIFQTIFAGCCWFFFAIALVQWMHYRMTRILAFTIVMLLSLSEPVIVWESCLISESVSISVLAAVIGAWLLFLKKGSRRHLALLITASVLWMLCRETNTWMMMLLAIILLPAAILKKNRQYIVLCSLLMITFTATTISSNIGKRWLFSLYNMIGTRILPDADHVAFFEHHGMPVTPALLSFTGQCASCNNWAFYKDPDLEEFRQWLYKNGKRTYMCWLAANPATTLREPLVNIALMLTPGSQFHYASPSSRRILPPALSKIMFPIGYQRYLSLVLIWTLVFLTGCATGAQRWKTGKAWMIAIMLVLLAYPHIIVVWHGDIAGYEVDRHALAARVQLNCAVWLMVCFTADQLLQRRRQYPKQSLKAAA